MKIKNLLLLGLMTIFSMNAFAAFEKVDGIWYDITASGAKVQAISAKMTDAVAETITIPATIKDGDGNTVKVIGFAANWANTGGSEDKNITAITKNIVVDVTNIAPADLNDAFAKLNKLATVTLKGTYAAADYTIGYNSYDGKGATSVTTVNLKDLKGKAKVIIDGTAFKTVTTVTTVTLPEQATEISANAFNGASALTAIDLKSVTKIGDNAFKGCAALATVNFSNATALTEIGANAFDGVPFATATATTIDLDLSGATALKTVDVTSFPAIAYTSVKLAGTALAGRDGDPIAYYDNFSTPFKTILGSAKATLTTLTLPSGLEAIANNQFQGFTALEAIGLPKGVVTIGNYAFDGCTGLQSIKIKGNVKYIQPNAFSGCTALVNINFSDAAALEWIGNNAFAGTAITTLDLTACPKLKQVYTGTFPANAYTSVKLAGTALAGRTDPANPTTYYDNFSTNFATILSGAQTSLTEITLPTGLEAIEDNQFFGFTGLTSVSMPKGVATIGVSAFEGTGLTAVKIRENVTWIKKRAFADCDDLAVVNFSEATALEIIGIEAFTNTAIKEVSIPVNADPKKSLEIRKGAFKDCKSLKSFAAKGLAGAIPAEAFSGDAKLTGIVIQAAITSIGNAAFKDCAALATVTFRHDGTEATGLTSIGNNAFENCAALAALDLSKTQITGISSTTPFKGCTSLAEITFPEAGFVTLSGNNLFADCPIENLYAPTVTSASAILFGNYWDKTTSKYVSRDAKHPNTTLKTVTIGGTIDTDCFAFCTALESVEYLGDPTTDIVDDYAFEHCTALTTFTYNPETLPTVLVVKNDAFHGCIPFVQFITNKNYMDCVASLNKGKAPVNASFGGQETSTIKTVQDKANAKQFIAKYVNNTTITASIKASEAKVYSIYVDGETAYFQALRTSNGKYFVAPLGTEAVIIKTDSEKEVNLTYDAADPDITPCVGFDDVYVSVAGDDLADVQDGAGVVAGKYLYRLTNTADQGFGFTFFTGTTIKADQFFVACAKKPAGAGRLNVVWLDEDGNVEGDATAIQKVENNTENNGAIYNLQGVRVENPVKGGIYIQNGKKFVK